MPASLAIRTLCPADLDDAEELCRIAGWNQLRTDWLRLLEHEPEGCFLAERDGQPIGTVTTTTYGTDLAWIGMMLVHPDFRRQGIATVLMERSLEYLRERGVRCIKLDATPAGEPVYERLGFRAEWEFHRWERSHPSPPATAPIPPAMSRLEPSPLDLDAFGADRTEWLNRLARESVLVRKGTDWGMGRTGRIASYLGPIIAENVESAGEIITQLLEAGALRHPEGRLFWDIPGPNAAGIELARSLGFEQSRPLLRMWTGEQLIAGRPERQFALGDPATG
jgi:GNAT superfamily N-acetyltransferase